MGDNPFAQDAGTPSYDANPFAIVPPSTVTTDSTGLTGATGESFQPQFEGRSENPFYPQGSAATVPVVHESNPKPANPFIAQGSKEEELARKERELLKRQEELNRREAQLPGGAQKKNFPKFYPLVYHNIEEDIPLDKQRVVRLAFYSYLGLCACLSFNWFAVTCELFRSGADETASWLYSGIYLIMGVLGAWYLWYARLYMACKGDRGLTFFFFFMAYSVHCAFCLWASLAPPGLLGEDHAFCGIFSMISIFTENGFIGVLYMIGMFLWIFETVLSAYVMRASYRMFRGAGHSQESVQNEAQRSAYANLV
mmetsp:Transcript_47671/g.91018  ORF Transcript_47671/g.91018 Transcript_47671/m.91018 type:complete len:311 (-) Transcript_47671:402-1334(-)